MPVTMDLQITSVENDQIGMSGLIKAQKDGNQDYFMIVDCLNSFVVSGLTSQLYEDLFAGYIQNSEDCKGIFLTQFIPLFPQFMIESLEQYDNEEKLNSKNNECKSSENYQNYQLGNKQVGKVKVIQSKKIETIGFMPRNRKQGCSRLFGQASELSEQIKQGQLSVMHNDVYIVSFKFKMIVDEFLHSCSITFKSISKVERIEDQLDCINLIFIEQTKQFDNSLSLSKDEVTSIFTKSQPANMTMYMKTNYGDRFSKTTTNQMISTQFRTSLRNQTFMKGQNDLENIPNHQKNDIEIQIKQQDQIENSINQNISQFSIKENIIFGTKKKLPSFKLIQNSQNSDSPSNLQSIANPNKDSKTNDSNLNSQTSIFSPKINNSDKLLDLIAQGKQPINSNFHKEQQGTILEIENTSQQKIKQSTSSRDNIPKSNQKEDIHAHLFGEPNINFHIQSTSSARTSLFNTEKKLIKNAFSSTKKYKFFEFFIIFAVISLSKYFYIYLIKAQGGREFHLFRDLFIKDFI